MDKMAIAIAVLLFLIAISVIWDYFYHKHLVIRMKSICESEYDMIFQSYNEIYFYCFTVDNRTIRVVEVQYSE